MNVGQRVRSTTDGQVGYIVEVEGAGLGVRLDRRAENRVVPFNPQTWVSDVKPPLGPMQVAQVAYAADRQLRHARGEYAVKEWMTVTEANRLEFAKNGPPKSDGERRRLYEAVIAAVKGE